MPGFVRTAAVVVLLAAAGVVSAAAGGWVMAVICWGMALLAVSGARR
jgi:hypothetical protein